MLYKSKTPKRGMVNDNSQMSVWRKKSAPKLCFSWTMDLFIKPFSVIIFLFDKATKLVILEIYA